MVEDLKALGQYPFCGHGVLLGKSKQNWQDDGYVLKYFAEGLGTARKRYLVYIEVGLAQGRRPDLIGEGIDLQYIAAKATKIYGIDAVEIFPGGRAKARADARGLFCYWAANELNTPLSDLARRLNMTPAGVSYAVRRGEALVCDNELKL